MSILAYCVSLSHDFLDAPPVGVDNATVFEVEDLGLRAWYSEVEEDTFSGNQRVTQAALGFHQFVSAVFREGTVLPFRFPTILETPDELRTHLEEQARRYMTALRASEGLAQFEARVFVKAAAPADANSGTEYLEARKRLRELANQAVGQLLAGLDDYLREHHVKESQQATRVYLLAERARAAAFREAAAKVAIPAGVEVRLSGPWPPTEFLPSGEEER